MLHTANQAGRAISTSLGARLGLQAGLDKLSGMAFGSG